MNDQLERARRVCLALPEASERLSHGEPTFFVRGKAFAMFANNHHGDGRVAVWLPAPPGFQEGLIETAPATFFRPPYVGGRGWVGVVLDAIDDAGLRLHIETAWGLVAPKRLRAAHRAAQAREVSLPELLRDAIDRLGRRDQVLGALLIGSLPAGALSPASDYDLVVIVDVGEPLWFVGVTELGGRFADIIFVAGRALTQIAALGAPVAHDHALAPVLRWLQEGAVVLDHIGLRAAQEHARAHGLLAPPGSESAYSAWFGLNYNLAVIRRLLQSDDPRYLAVADIRMAVYGHADLWFGYGAIRGQPWPGDKAAARALEAQDPDYLALFRQFIAESRRAEKARRYAELAALAAAPLGGLWPPGWTGENLAQPPLRVAELLGPDAELTAPPL